MFLFHYAIRELVYRRIRSLITMVSVAIAVLATVLLTELATTYAKAIHAPVATVGADMVVQITGDIPPKLEGLVFPHPNALIPASAVARIGAIQGVLSMTRGVYLWELAPDHYQSVLGLDDGEAGLPAVSARLSEGRKLLTTDSAVLIDSDFASKHALHLGSVLNVGGSAFPVVGIVDASRSNTMARADVYMPLAKAQRLAASAPQVQALYPFGGDDCNLLLVKVERDQLEQVVAQVRELLGKKAVISSELSFREALSGVLFLSERMSVIVAVVIGLFASGFVFRATASAINERRRELAILQAVGWPWAGVRYEVLIENAILAVTGVLLGLLAAMAITAIVGTISVSVELPWDLSSTPHFIPEATINRTQTTTVPLQVSWVIATAASAGAVVITVAVAAALLTRATRQPWSLLRGE